MSTPAALPDRFNFADHLLTQNASRPGKVAFLDDHGSLTYGQLDERVRRLATGLRSLFLRREERVLVLMHDCNDWPVAFLGSMYAGLVPVAVNTLLTADDYAYMLEHSRAQAVMVSGALLPTLNAAMIKSDHEVQKVIVSHPQAPLHPSEVEFEAFLQHMHRKISQPPPVRTTPASGFTPADPLGVQRGPCTRMATLTGRASSMPKGFWACGKTTFAFLPPNCSSPTAWAMGSPSP